ncbi:hypothetical protein RHMOL_Rhmol04G0210000 [Rhododendron molle]|uniref:Uncharacterized protein n=1 Tax=Rhododendron molle TaxID=49168 RepID=A0ACC0P2Q1_RHOML|nr:hypothetical protein RHMOL_Rhmol04G0210000 [Rhododendron molle]
MADHGDGGCGGKVVDRPEDQGGPMAVETVDQGPVETVGNIGTEVAGGGDGEQGGEQEAAGGKEPRAVEAEGRARETPGATGPSAKPLDTGMAAGDSE